MYVHNSLQIGNATVFNKVFITLKSFTQILLQFISQIKFKNNLMDLLLCFEWVFHIFLRSIVIFQTAPNSNAIKKNFVNIYLN